MDLETIEHGFLACEALKGMWEKVGLLRRKIGLFARLDFG
jgi:hypothetical protein